MKKSIMLLTMMLTISLMSYSNDTTKIQSRGKAIAIALAEGLECKEILVEKNVQLVKKDSAISKLDSSLTDKTKQLSLEKENNTIVKGQNQILLRKNNDLETKVTDAQNQTNKEQKRKKNWRNLAIIETAILGIIAYITFK
jgi:hypothetical protein